MLQDALLRQGVFLPGDLLQQTQIQYSTLLFQLSETHKILVIYQVQDMVVELHHLKLVVYFLEVLHIQVHQEQI